jgi:hypothetical protein
MEIYFPEKRIINQDLKHKNKHILEQLSSPEKSHDLLHKLHDTQTFVLAELQEKHQEELAIALSDLYSYMPSYINQTMRWPTRFDVFPAARPDRTSVYHATCAASHASSRCPKVAPGYACIFVSNLCF